MSGTVWSNSYIAAPVAWECESIRPGMTVLPSRSICRVAGPASFRTSALEPTLTMRPPSIAIASAIEKLASTVRTLPLWRIRSGVCAGSTTQRIPQIAAAMNRPKVRMPSSCHERAELLRLAGQGPMIGLCGSQFSHLQARRSSPWAKMPRFYCHRYFSSNSRTPVHSS